MKLSDLIKMLQECQVKNSGHDPLVVGLLVEDVQDRDYPCTVDAIDCAPSEDVVTIKFSRY